MAHYTGLQYDIFSRSALQKSADRFIRFFDAVHRQRNIFLANGTEQEFRANIGEKDVMFPKHDSGISLTDTQKVELTRLQGLEKKLQDYYVNSLERSGSWREGGEVFDYLDRVEFDLRAKKLEVVTKPQSLIRSAYSLWSNNRGLFSGSLESGAKRENGDAIGFHSQKTEMRFPYIKKVRFEPGHNNVGDTPIKSSFSQHYNFSANFCGSADANGNMPARLLEENLNMQNLMEDENVRAVFADVGLDVAKADMMLLLANPNSYHRLAESHLDRHHIDEVSTAIFMHDDGKRSRVEFRLADSSTDPFLGVLAVSAISYLGMSIIAPEKTDDPNYFEAAKAKAKTYAAENGFSFLNHKERPTARLLVAEKHDCGADFDYMRDYFANMTVNFQERSMVVRAMRQAIRENPDIAEQSGVSEKDVDTFAAEAVKWARNNRYNIAKLDTVKEAHVFK